MAVTLILLNLCTIKTFATFPGWKAEPFPLSQVQLNPSSRYGQVQAEELNYLLTLDSTRLVCRYLLAANLSKTCNPYPFAHNDYGHFIGHYLSSSALLYSNTGNKTLETKMNGIIASLQQCETAWTNIGYVGYLFTYSPVEFEILEGELPPQKLPVAVPFYVMHKVLAGLIDQYIHANSTAALKLVKRMGDWVVGNVNETISKKGISGWQGVLNTEWGGMNEALYNLYGITGNNKYLVTGNYFDHYSFSRPLANNIDDLTGLHANTHIPEISGSARGYEVNGNETQRDITINFFNILNGTRTFSTGGSNDNEHWGAPYQLGDEMNANTQESCTQYNILKVARYIYTWNGDSFMMDYYERTIMNGLIGNLNMETPQYFYFNPLGGGGLTKPWGDAYSSFWCCWGTLTESFGKLSDSIYFHTINSETKQAEIFVNQYVASTLNWDEIGISITQNTQYPINSDGSTTSIIINKVNKSGIINGDFILSLRVPWWTKNDGAFVKINGIPIDNSLIVPKTYLNLGLNDNIVFKTGDIINIKFPMFARWERLNDNRTEWKDVGVFMYGPILLAGITDSVYFDIDLNKIAIYPVGDGSNKFIAIDVNGNNITMIPQMDIIHEVYTIYFKDSQAGILPYNASGILPDRIS
eukprot:521016_1